VQPSFSWEVEDPLPAETAGLGVEEVVEFLSHNKKEINGKRNDNYPD
jgi:hypothetical protein